MSRSPFSPLGKRMKTMQDESDDDTSSHEDKNFFLSVNLADTTSSGSSQQSITTSTHRHNIDQEELESSVDENSNVDWPAIDVIYETSSSSAPSFSSIAENCTIVEHYFPAFQRASTSRSPDEPLCLFEAALNGVFKESSTNDSTNASDSSSSSDNSVSIIYSSESISTESESRLYDSDHGQSELNDLSESNESIESSGPSVSSSELIDRWSLNPSSPDLILSPDYNQSTPDNPTPDLVDNYNYHINMEGFFGDRFSPGPLPDDYLRFDPTPDTPYPRPNWITTHELRQRKYGFSSSTQYLPKSSPHLFERHAKNSLWMIQRLELSYKLEEHTGCVNSLDFSSTGKLLCSSGDDKEICIWDWNHKRLRAKITSGHSESVFHSEFCNQDNDIITTSRDGSVRMTNLETGQSEQLFAIPGNDLSYEIESLAFLTPQTLVTCSADGSVNHIDLRTNEAFRLFTVMLPRSNRPCPLHTISVNPSRKHKVAVAGSSPYLFLYDMRNIVREDDDTPSYFFNHLDDKSNIITSTAFNSTGDKLLISYNDDDLLVCETMTFGVKHRYKGHRNRKTIKGCTWFGDNYVMSGSDDGHIYGWDLESEHIVCFLDADVRGIVNKLCVHPELPILASSGLDHDVKIWEPTAKTWPQTLTGIKSHICRNTISRGKESKLNPPLLFCLTGSDSDSD